MGETGERGRLPARFRLPLAAERTEGVVTLPVPLGTGVTMPDEHDGHDRRLCLEIVAAAG